MPDLSQRGSGLYAHVARGLRGIVRRPWMLALLMNSTLFAFGLLLCRSSGEEWVRSCNAVMA